MRKPMQTARGRAWLQQYLKGNLSQVLVDHDFEKQADFVLDDSPFLGAQCTRRAGKSYGIGLKLYRASVIHPGSSSLYLALTRPSAKNIMWEQVIKQINKECYLGGKPNEAELTMVFPNNSRIILAGADQSYQEMEKYLGGKYPLVVIDEAGSFKQDLHTMVYENLMPAVADYDGQVCLIGTATRFLHTLFYKITTGEEAGWKVHKWDTKDNPYMAKAWEKQIAILKNKDRHIEEKPYFRRMYMNEWVLDSTDLVYKYIRERNWVPELPAAGGWTKIGGIDLGWEDPTAFMIGNYNEHVSRNLYFSNPYKASQMTLTDVEKKLREYQHKFNPRLWVIDNANKQAVEELKYRTGLNLIAAEKTGKADFIEIMNGGWLDGTIQVVGEAAPYEQELKTLIWDKLEPGQTSTRKVGTGSDKKEHPKYDNHLCDTGLYIWRHCYQYLFSEQERSVQSEENRVDDWWEKQSEAGKGGYEETIKDADILGIGSGEDDFFGDAY